MAEDAVISGWHQGTVDAADAAGGVAIGTAVGNKAAFGRLKKRCKVATGRELGWSKSRCGMAGDAPVSGQRVWKWNRADTIVLGPATMTTLATGARFGKM